MYRCEEEARHEGIRLLEIHVKLLREARAALGGHTITECDGPESDGPPRDAYKAKHKLIEEIDMVEQEIETWQKAYGDQYMQGNDVWDMIGEEEEENSDTKQGREEEAAEEEREQIRENPSKELTDIVECNIENVIPDRQELEQEDKNLTEKERETLFFEKQLKAHNSSKKDYKKIEEIEMTQESDMNQDLDAETQQAILRLYQDNEGNRKRPLEEIEEEEEETAKRRKVVSPDGTVTQDAGGHKVLVQNLPVTFQYNDLRNYFIKFGSVNKVFLRNGGACGFVIYDSEEIADFVCGLHHRLCDQDVKVLRATPHHPPPCPDPGNPNFEVFVFGVPLETDATMLRSALASLAPVVSVAQPRGKNYAFARFEDESGKEAALRAQAVTLNGRKLSIRQRKTDSEEGKTSSSVPMETTWEAAVTDSNRPRKEYKVFLHGVTVNLDLHGFQMAFDKFGKVVSAYKPISKNFAFVGFETEEAQRAALKAGVILLPFGWVTVKPATQK